MRPPGPPKGSAGRARGPPVTRLAGSTFQATIVKTSQRFRLVPARNVYGPATLRETPHIFQGTLPSLLEGTPTILASLSDAAGGPRSKRAQRRPWGPQGFPGHPKGSQGAPPGAPAISFTGARIPVAPFKGASPVAPVGGAIPIAPMEWHHWGNSGDPKGSQGTPGDPMGPQEIPGDPRGISGDTRGQPWAPWGHSSGNAVWGTTGK